MISLTELGKPNEDCTLGNEGQSYMEISSLMVNIYIYPKSRLFCQIWVIEGVHYEKIITYCITIITDCWVF